MLIGFYLLPSKIQNKTTAFLSNVRETIRNKGLKALQIILLKDLLKVDWLIGV
jgi:hypothetical protein